MFREGRVIIPAGGWYEWTVENGKKQPWYITRKMNEPILMSGLTNFKPYTHQTVDVGFVIVTADSGAGTVDVHDRRPVVLEREDAWRWMNPETPVEEAAHIAQRRSIRTEEFMWWKVNRAVNRPEPVAINLFCISIQASTFDPCDCSFIAVWRPWNDFCLLAETHVCKRLLGVGPKG
jgi:putative SOS response-associated peptidase YedK